MPSKAAELLGSCDLTPLFVEVLGWERNVGTLPVTIVEISVASPRTLAFRLTGIAQKRGAQVFLCPPDEYGRIPNQTTRRLIQDQVKRAAHHNIVVFIDAARRLQVWQWAERRVEERSMRVYEHRIGNEEQTAEMLSRLTAITFNFDEEPRLTLVDVVQRLKAAFADDHAHIQRGRHGRDGLRAYDLAEMDQGICYWWERVLREPRLNSEEEYLVACAMRSGDLRALDLLVRSASASGRPDRLACGGQAPLPTYGLPGPGPDRQLGDDPCCPWIQSRRRCALPNLCHFPCQENIEPNPSG